MPPDLTVDFTTRPALRVTRERLWFQEMPPDFTEDFTTRPAFFVFFIETARFLYPFPPVSLG